MIGKHGRQAACFGVALAAATLSVSATAQVEAEAPAVSPQLRARRLVRRLALPSERARVVDELLALGETAVPALARALRGAQPEVVPIALQMLRMLGTRAAAALPQLARMRASGDSERARMAEWAEMRIREPTRTLFCPYTQNKVIAIGADGKPQDVLTGLDRVWDFDPLPGGRFLLSLYGPHKVVIVDAKGKEQWEFKDVKMPLDVDALVNGNVLVVDSGGERVLEVNPAGKIVWKHAVKMARDADRLPNGNTLIATTQGDVIEVTPKGEIAWRYKSPGGGVYDADRLPNGNTLLALYNQNVIREIDAQGKPVRLLPKMKGAITAMALPNGNVLVGGNHHVLECDPKGKVLWKHKTGTLVSAVHRN